LHDWRPEEHERLLQACRDLDRQFIQHEVARFIARPHSAPAGLDAEIALLMKEAEKTTEHLPLPQLFGAMPALLLHLKPCVLTNPLSVSKFLPMDANAPQFDLVIFHAASQIRLECAIAAICRGRQLVVVGDNQQPPSAASIEDDGADGAEDEKTPPG